MAKKKPSDGQGTFEALRSTKAIQTGYYSGDKPNPNLRGFVEQKYVPYDPATDTYEVSPFNQPIETTKATAVHNMHGYHLDNEEGGPGTAEEREASPHRSAPR